MIISSLGDSAKIHSTERSMPFFGGLWRNERYILAPFARARDLNGTE
jgi:hypothetical protein